MQFEKFARRTGHSCRRRIGFETPRTAATTKTPVGTHNDMSQLAGISVAPVNQLAVGDNPATDPCTECDHDKILHAPRRTVSHLSDGGSVGIIGYLHRNAELLFHQFGKRNNPLPGQICGILDRSFEIVGIRSTYTYPPYFSFKTVGSCQSRKSLMQIFDIIFDTLMFVGFNGIFGEHSSPTVDNTEFGIGSTDIDSYDIRFHGNGILKIVIR